MPVRMMKTQITQTLLYSLSPSPSPPLLLMLTLFLSPSLKKKVNFLKVDKILALCTLHFQTPPIIPKNVL